MSADQIRALVCAERMGLMPTATALIEASRKADQAHRDAEWTTRSADMELSHAWSMLDAALALTSLGELDREQVIVALMDRDS